MTVKFVITKNGLGQLMIQELNNKQLFPLFKPYMTIYWFN